MPLERFLIIGGSGFLGSHIIDELILLKYPVAIFDISAPKDPEQQIILQKNNIRVFKGDLCSSDDILKTFSEFKPTVILNTATPSPMTKDPIIFQRVNVEGTRNVLECCGKYGVKKYVMTSSISLTETYDDHPTALTEADCKYLPDDHEHPYYTSKIQQEKLVLEANGNDKGMMTCCLRPHRLWGPRDTTMTPRLLEQGGMPFMLGNGKNIVDFTFVKNIAHALIIAGLKLKNPKRKPAGEIYLITDDHPMSFWEFVGDLWEGMNYSRPWIPVPFVIIWVIALFVRMVCSILNYVSGKNVWHPPVAFDLIYLQLIVVNKFYDISKAKKELGYQPVVSYKEGMKMTLKYYLKKGYGSVGNNSNERIVND